MAFVCSDSSLEELVFVVINTYQDLVVDVVVIRLGYVRRGMGPNTVKSWQNEEETNL